MATWVFVNDTSAMLHAFHACLKPSELQIHHAPPVLKATSWWAKLVRRKRLSGHPMAALSALQATTQFTIAHVSMALFPMGAMGVSSGEVVLPAVLQVGRVVMPIGLAKVASREVMVGCFTAGVPPAF